MDLCRAYNLGIIEYEQALKLQNRLVSARIAGEIPDTILLLQHPPVITIGRSGSERNIIVPEDLLASEGITVHHIDRGGDITVHSPGQLIVYLILDLKPAGMGLHQYVRNLEEVAIQTLNTFAITARRDSKYPGVWVGLEKICALGVRVSRWVTKHGLALNVNNDLKYFTYINPCGIRDRQVTSMANIMGNSISLDEVASCLFEQCARIFNMDIRKESQELEVNYAR